MLWTVLKFQSHEVCDFNFLNGQMNAIFMRIDRRLIYLIIFRSILRICYVVRLTRLVFTAFTKARYSLDPRSCVQNDHRGKKTKISNIFFQFPRAYILADVIIVIDGDFVRRHA